MTSSEQDERKLKYGYNPHDGGEYISKVRRSSLGWSVTGERQPIPGISRSLIFACALICSARLPWKVLHVPTGFSPATLASVTKLLLANNV